MNQKLVIAGAALCLQLFFFSCADASDFGFINIREISPTQGTSEEEYDPDKLGFVRIPGSIVPDKPKEQIPTEEAGKISPLIAKAVEAQTKRRFSDAYIIMESLRRKYPEIPMFWRWASIYADLAGEAEESLNIWKEYKSYFPMEKTGIEEWFYKADALIRLKRNDEALQIIDAVIDEIEKPKGLEAFSQKADKKIIKTSFLYIKAKANEWGTNPEKVGEIWDSIPRDMKDSLSNYYGFDLAELWLWHGREFGRPKDLEKYIEVEKENENKDAIKNCQEAKRILYREYGKG